MGISIVVLAAGQGTRMRSSLPKVLHPIGGKPMLLHVLETAKSLEPDQIIVVHGHEREQVKNAVQDDEILWVHQEEQLGTGHALLCALPLLTPGNQVLILYGDVPLISQKTLQKLIRKSNDKTLALLTVIAKNPTGLGRIFRDKNGAIVKIIEEKEAKDSERLIKEVNTGIFLASREMFSNWLPRLSSDNAQTEYYLTDIVEFAVSDGVAVVTESPDFKEEFLGVNDRQQQSMVERIFQRWQAEKYQQAGVRIIDANRFDLRGTLEAGRDVTIDVNVILEGKVKLGDGTLIGPNSILIDCKIGDGVIIKANSHLEGVIVENNSEIGPFARLRPGTILAKSAKIGNFVEIKNSEIGAGSKINHLSYVGDTTMGQEVNVGAGTITCNYDGANKYRTIIGDNVHIGSDTQLIAPITITEGATLAAGSTVRKNVESAGLTLTHKLEQRAIARWKRPVKEKK